MAKKAKKRLDQKKVIKKHDEGRILNVLLVLVVAVLLIIEVSYIINVPERDLPDKPFDKDLLNKAMGFELMDGFESSFSPAVLQVDRNYVGYEEAVDVDEEVPSIPVRNTPPETSKIVFSSGRGASAVDKMNYMDYESEFYFTPSYDMEINTIEPDVYSCLEKCEYSAAIYNEHGELLAEKTDRGNTPNELIGRFDKDVVLKAGLKYKIHQHIKSTKSVGIYTAGRDDRKKTNGEYTVVYSKSDYYVDYKNHGPIVFNIRGAIMDSATFESSSWLCRGRSRRNEVITYEFNEVKRETKCKTKREWNNFAEQLCDSLCVEEKCNLDVKELIYGKECD